MDNKSILTVQIFNDKEYLTKFMKSYVGVICDGEEMDMSSDVLFISFEDDKDAFARKITDSLKNNYTAVLLACDVRGFSGNYTIGGIENTLFWHAVRLIEQQLGDSTTQILHIVLCTNGTEPAYCFTESKSELAAHRIMYDFFVYFWGSTYSYPTALIVAIKARLQYSPRKAMRYLKQNFYSCMKTGEPNLTTYQCHIIARWLVEATEDDLEALAPYLGKFDYDFFALFPEYERGMSFLKESKEYRLLNNSIYSPLIKQAAKGNYCTALEITVIGGEGTSAEARKFIQIALPKNLWRYIYYNSAVLNDTMYGTNSTAPEVMLALINLLECYPIKQLQRICLNPENENETFDVVGILIYELEFYISEHKLKDDELYFFSVLSRMESSSDDFADDLTAHFLGLRSRSLFDPKRAAYFQLFPRKQLPPMYRIMYLMAEKFHSGRDKRFGKDIPLAVRLYNGAMGEYAPSGCSKALEALYLYFKDGNSTENYLRIFAPLINGAEKDGQPENLKYIARIKKIAEKNEKIMKARKDND